MELSSDKNYDSNGQLKTFISFIKNFSLFYQCRLTLYILNLKICFINRGKISRYTELLKCMRNKLTN